MPAREIAPLTVTPWSAGIKTTWSVSEVRSALRLHAEGDFSSSAQLFDTMGEDDHLPGELDKRVGGVLGSAFSLNPVEAPSKSASQRLVERYKSIWFDIFSEAELGELLRWRRMLGVGLGVLDWERGGSEWRARLRTLHPQFLRWDQFERRWLYRAQEGELVVTPGDGRWVLLTDGQRGWMNCGVRSLAVTWLAKQQTIRDWNRYNERHGLPIVKAFAPAIADDADKDQFWEDVRVLHSETVAQLPTHLDETDAKFDLDLLEAKDQSWQTFPAQLARADRRISTYLLGQNLATEVDGQGSRAAADTHRGVERDKAKVDAENLATELRRQALFPIIAFNVPNVSLEIVPWPKWNTDPAGEDEAQAKAKKTFAEALRTFTNGGYEVENLDELCERYGIKLKKIKAKPEAQRFRNPLPANDEDEDEEESEDEDDERDDVAARRSHRGLRLRSGLTAAESSGFLNGQLYADALVERAAKQGVAALKPSIDAILEELDAATGYDDLRERLRARYEELEPEEISALIEAACVMAELAGRAAVNEDS